MYTCRFNLVPVSSKKKKAPLKFTRRSHRAFLAARLLNLVLVYQHIYLSFQLCGRDSQSGRVGRNQLGRCGGVELSMGRPMLVGMVMSILPSL